MAIIACKYHRPGSRQFIRKNIVRNLKKNEVETGDKDPQQDVGEDSQEGSQQLKLAIT